MADPYLDSGESFIVTTHRISAGFALYDMMLTTRNLVLVDSGSARFEPEKIALATVLSVTAGRVATGEPVIILHFMGTGDGSAGCEPMNLLFTQQPGENRKQERDVWIRRLMEQVVAVHRPQEPADERMVVNGAGYIHPSAAPVRGIETALPHKSVIGMEPAAVEPDIRVEEEAELPVQPGQQATDGMVPEPEPIPAATVAGEPKDWPASGAAAGMPEERAGARRLPVREPLFEDGGKAPAGRGRRETGDTAPVTGMQPARDPFEDAIRALQQSAAARDATGSTAGSDTPPVPEDRLEPAGAKEDSGLFSRLFTPVRSLFTGAGQTGGAHEPAHARGPEQEDTVPGGSEPVPAGSREPAMTGAGPDTPPHGKELRRIAGTVVPVSGQEPGEQPAVPMTQGVPGMEPAVPEDEGEASGPPPFPPGELPEATAAIPGAGAGPVREEPVHPVSTLGPEPAVTGPGEADTPMGAAIPGGEGPVPGLPEESGEEPAAPSDGSPRDSSLPAAAALAIALILAAAVFFSLPLMGNGAPGEITPVPPTPVPATPTPSQTLEPAPAPLPVAGAGSGVWVRVNYTGRYTGYVGNPGSLQYVGGTGDRFYPVTKSTDLVQASFEKQDFLGEPLVVSVYRNGTMIYTRSVTAPKGSLDFIIDPATGGFPGGIPTPTSVTGLVPGETYRY